jgi:hypothetical protein
MRRWARTALLAGTALALGLPTSTVASPALPEAPLDPDHPFDSGPQECLEPAPAAIDVKGVTDDNRTVKLDLAVPIAVAESAEIQALLADSDPARAAEGQARFDALVQKVHGILDAAITTYAPLGVDLRMHYDLMVSRTTNIDELIAHGKQHFGGRLPQGIDAVYSITDLDVSGSVAGKADCIGGIRYADRAFAAGEIDLNEAPLNFFGVTMFQDISAKILSHEVGHLLGAHHHYSSCVEGIPTETVADALSVCTLMINDIGLASLNFSSLNGAIVRGHSVDFASSNDG